MPANPDIVIHRGGCHCGEVRFEVHAAENIDVYDCNCSICQLLAYLHLVVPRDRFHLISGHSNLVTYTFNTGIAQHHFCKTCGIKSFYVPRSHPDQVSVNVRCIEPDTINKITTIPINGAEDELAD
jgi:hypothetical protein